MAEERLQFPDPIHSPWKDHRGQTWEWNGEAWVRKAVQVEITTDAPKNGQQYVRQDGEWVLSTPDEWYLGPKDAAPLLDNNGNPLQEGMTYYDDTTHTMYVFDGVEWDAFSGVSEIATLWEYRYDNVDLSAAATTPVVVDVGAGDDHGNVPFDQWIRGTIIVSVYVDGARIIEQRLLTPAGQNTNPRPQDEETPTVAVLDSANEAAIFALDINDGYDVGAIAIAQDTGISYRCTDSTAGASVWVKGGAELDNYDFMVDYDNQTITILSNFTAASKVVIETGTLAASAYIKITNDNASEWDFVSQDPTMQSVIGGSVGLLPSERAVYQFVSSIRTLIEAQIATAKAEALENRIGTIFDFAGPTPPVGALECNGQIVHKDTYPLLFAAIGHTWDTFNGAEAPDSTSEFRVPPQHVNGHPLFMGGRGSHIVGEYVESQNKAHRHTNKHSHSGSTNNAGGHTHNLLIRNPGGNIAAGDSIQWYRGHKMWYENTGGPSNRHELVQSVGHHNHDVHVDPSNITTSEDGGDVNLPDTAVVLKCIWVDI